MKISRISAALAATAILSASCSSHTDEPAQGTELRLHTAMEGNSYPSRASGSLRATTLEDGLHAGVFVYDGNGNTYASNTPYTVNNSTLTSTSPIYFNSADPISIRSYAPYTDNVDADGKTISHSIAHDQSTDDAYLASDLVTSSLLTGVTFRDNPVMLTFHHAMSQICISVKASADFPSGKSLNGAELFINSMPLNGTYDFENQIWNVDNNSKSNIKAGVFTNETTTINAVVFPATYEAGSLTITLHLADGTDFVYKNTRTIDMKSGASTRFDLTARSMVLTLDQCSVTEWSTGESAEVIPGQITYDPSETAVGDYITKDGKFIVMNGNSILPDNLKDQVVAVIFHVGHHTSDLSDYSSTGVGSKECHGYAVALINASEEALKWGPNNIFLSTSTNESDFQGFFNTSCLRKQSESMGAASFATNYPSAQAIFDFGIIKYTGHCAPPTTSGWFYPSIGQLRSIRNNLSPIVSRFEKVGGKWLDSFTWSSTEQDLRYARCLKLSDGTDYWYTHKPNLHSVRAILAY